MTSLLIHHSDDSKACGNKVVRPTAPAHLLKCCPKLTHLTLATCVWPTSTLPELPSLAAHLLDLEMLNVTLKSLHALSRLTALTRLRMSRVITAPSSPGANLTAYTLDEWDMGPLKTLKRLQILELLGLCLDHTSWHNALALPALKNFHCLTLNEPHDESENNILAALRRAPQLERLMLQQLEAPVATLRCLAATPRLTKLELQCVAMTAADLGHLSPLAALQELTFSRLGRVRADSLNRLTKLTTLTSLDLVSHVLVPYAALATLARALPLRFLKTSFAAPRDPSPVAAMTLADARGIANSTLESLWIPLQAGAPAPGVVAALAAAPRLSMLRLYDGAGQWDLAPLSIATGLTELVVHEYSQGTCALLQVAGTMELLAKLTNIEDLSVRSCFAMLPHSTLHAQRAGAGTSAD